MTEAEFDIWQKTIHDLQGQILKLESKVDALSLTIEAWEKYFELTNFLEKSGLPKPEGLNKAMEEIIRVTKLANESQK